MSSIKKFRIIKFKSKPILAAKSISKSFDGRIVLRKIDDTDNRVEVIERFDGCNLNPSSPNFVARKIGDIYYQWDSSNKRLRQYGEYPNLSKFIRIEMNNDVEAGATDPALIPFGYYASPRYAALNSATNAAVPNARAMVHYSSGVATRLNLHCLDTAVSRYSSIDEFTAP